MATPHTIAKHERVPLTRFHNNTGEFLDLSTRTPVILTSHGRERHVITDIAYFRQLEAAAAGRIIEAMDLRAVRANDMSADDRAALQSALPSADEVARDRWDD